MAKDDRLAFAPIFVENLNAVFGRDAVYTYFSRMRLRLCSALSSAKASILLLTVDPAGASAYRTKQRRQRAGDPSRPRTDLPEISNNDPSGHLAPRKKRRAKRSLSGSARSLAMTPQGREPIQLQQQIYKVGAAAWALGANSTLAPWASSCTIWRTSSDVAHVRAGSYEAGMRPNFLLGFDITAFVMGPITSRHSESLRGKNHSYSQGDTD
jgi:hypothetical protein